MTSAYTGSARPPEPRWNLDGSGFAGPPSVDSVAEGLVQSDLVEGNKLDEENRCELIFGFGSEQRAWRPVPEELADVVRGDEAISLTPLEFDLLVALCRREGRVAGRLELLKEVWGHLGEVLTRTVDTHIAELRRKLEDHPSEPKHIPTVRKAGYRMNMAG